MNEPENRVWGAAVNATTRRSEFTCLYAQCDLPWRAAAAYMLCTAFQPQLMALLLLVSKLRGGKPVRFGVFDTSSHKPKETP